MIAPTEMKRKILEVARRLVQTRGYDAFSYADVAGEVGIRKASVHHHFAAKGDLGLAILRQFRGECRSAFVEIDAAAGPAPKKLERYAGLFEATLRDGGRMCLCGMLAAGHETLPGPIRAELVEALEEHLTWLSSTLKEGRKAGELGFQGPPRRQAQAVFAGLEGGLLLARAHGDPSLLRGVARTLLAGLGATSPRNLGPSAE